MTPASIKVHPDTGEESGLHHDVQSYLTQGAASSESSWGQGNQPWNKGYFSIRDGEAIDLSEVPRTEVNAFRLSVKKMAETDVPGAASEL